MKNIKFIFAAVFIIFLAVYLSLILNKKKSESFQTVNAPWWEVQSIDTVKYSRDLAREKAKDAEFDRVIDDHVRLISETGATHVAIGTPYEEEFIPFMKRWIKAARKYHLNVWFRGNVAGWEGWFGYEKVDRSTHINQVKEFITSNGELFEEGDIFTPCTECENGGPGDPRFTGDVEGFRKFIIDEYQVANGAFRKIGKNVRSNFAPMNGDVAELIMDADTTKAMGGIIVIDHYVEFGQELAADVKRIAGKTKGKVVIGEFGAPVPDIHGEMDEDKQADWLKDTLMSLSETPDLVGINYWTSFGGSTKLWNDDLKQRKAVDVLGTFYKPKYLTGKIINTAGEEIKDAKVSSESRQVFTDNKGRFVLATAEGKEALFVQADGYRDYNFLLKSGENPEIKLTPEHESLFYIIKNIIYEVSN